MTDPTPMVHTYRGLIELSDDLKDQVNAGTINRVLAVERMLASALASMTYGPKAQQKSMMRDMGIVALDFRKWAMQLPPITHVPGRAQVAAPRTKILAIAVTDAIARDWWARQSDDMREKSQIWIATNRDAVRQFLRGTLDTPVYVIGEVPWIDEYLWGDIRHRTTIIHLEKF